MRTFSVYVETGRASCLIAGLLKYSGSEFQTVGALKRKHESRTCCDRQRYSQLIDGGCAQMSATAERNNRI